MPTPERTLWRRYCEQHLADRGLGFSLDVSRAGLDEDDLQAMTPAVERALAVMTALEGGAIANPDENRMVGHYWLRAPELAPTAETQREIRDAVAATRAFATRVHDGAVAGAGGRFEHVLHLGVGGSALGPQLVADALGGAADPVTLHFIDNTDPDGIDRVLATLDGRLDRTLVTVASKSGGTAEPRNALLETLAAYKRAGIDPAPHFVAITVRGSTLDRSAETEGWLARFPLWDWVGGRTSVTSTVGLVPAALLGVDIDQFLDGAAAMDRLTRGHDVRRNPAALLALAWHHLGDGRGARNMVVLPYKDRLVLLGRFLQQLVMESLGKACDRSGATVHQGLTVYGNKGSTDQHAYVQQLRDGPADFFATFVRVLGDRDGVSIDVEPDVTSGDYLHGSLLGTRAALHESGRPSVTITLDRLTPRTLGALIALFERTVGLYGDLIDVNAYDQPGVEAGKLAATAILSLQTDVVMHLRAAGRPLTADEIASALDRPDDAENVFVILEHLAANPERGVSITRGDRPDRTTFSG